MRHTAFDAATAAQAFARPGMDTRHWLSFGTVSRETSEQKSVEFDENLGPLVNVTLQPSGLPVRCRVGSDVAGNGEGEWFPFLEADEVLVAIPEGDERAGCTIIRRLNNGIDKFPTVVGGAEVNKNNFAFRRLRTPYIIETAKSYLVRSATTGAFFGITEAGAVTFSNAGGGFLQLGADLIGMQNGDADVIMQIDVEHALIRLEAQGTRFEISGTESRFTTTGTLALGTAGGLPSGHAVTLEQVVSLLVNFVYLLTGPQGSTTLLTELSLPGKLLGALGFPVNFVTGLTAMLNFAALPTPPTPVTGGGMFFPGIPEVINAAMSSAATASAVDQTGFIPGLGRPGLTL